MQIEKVTKRIFFCCFVQCFEALAARDSLQVTGVI